MKGSCCLGLVRICVSRSALKEGMASPSQQDDRIDHESVLDALQSAADCMMVLPCQDVADEPPERVYSDTLICRA